MSKKKLDDKALEKVSGGRLGVGGAPGPGDFNRDPSVGGNDQPDPQEGGSGGVDLDPQEK